MIIIENAADCCLSLSHAQAHRGNRLFLLVLLIEYGNELLADNTAGSIQATPAHKSRQNEQQKHFSSAERTFRTKPSHSIRLTTFDNIFGVRCSNCLLSAHGSGTKRQAKTKLINETTQRAPVSLSRWQLHARPFIITHIMAAVKTSHCHTPSCLYFYALNGNGKCDGMLLLVELMLCLEFRIAALLWIMAMMCNSKSDAFQTLVFRLESIECMRF